MRTPLTPVTTLVMLLAAAPAAHAQGTSAGVTAGFGWTTMAGVDGSEAGGTPSWKPGFAGGVFAIVPLDDRRRPRALAIEPELLIVQKGVRARTSDLDNHDRTYEYFQLPVLARAGTLGQAPGLFVVAGPALDVLLASHGSLALPEPPRIDVSVVLGAGVSTGEFTIETRYDGGLRGPQRSRAVTTFVHVRF
jgi:hypothetical protein